MVRSPVLLPCSALLYAHPGRTNARLTTRTPHRHSIPLFVCHFLDGIRALKPFSRCTDFTFTLLIQMLQTLTHSVTFVINHIRLAAPTAHEIAPLIYSDASAQSLSGLCRQAHALFHCRFTVADVNA